MRNGILMEMVTLLLAIKTNTDDILRKIFPETLWDVREQEDTGKRRGRSHI